MNYPAESILVNSPYIHSVWQGVAPRDDTHVAAADGNLDLVIMKRDNRTRILLSGPTSRARAVPYRQGDENIGIRLSRGVYLPTLPAGKMLDVETFLPNAGNKGFWFQGSVIPFPEFDTLESFIDRLVKLHILRRDIVVEDVMAGRVRPGTLRTVQRHFLQTTGLTPYYIAQIQRAEEATQLIAQGRPLTQIAQEVGFSDQAHMTNSLKRLVGYTPGQLQRLLWP